MNIQLGSLIKNSSFGNISSSNQVAIKIKDKSGSSVKAIKQTLNLPDTKNTIKKKQHLTPQQIAKRIAEGKNVTLEQRKLLQSEDPVLYAKAMMANQMRENLENRLKNAKSETAQAQAVAQAMAQAISMSKSEEQAGVPAQENGLPLYMSAIREAIKNAAHPNEGIQEELNQMVDEGLDKYETYEQAEGQIANENGFAAEMMSIDTISV